MEPRVRSYAGCIRKKIFENTANGFAVALFELHNGDGVASPTKESFVVVGPLSGLSPNQQVTLEGRWTEHSRYGPQFEVLAYHYEAPATQEGIVGYLSSRLFKGIGPALAKRIVDVFGEKALWVVENEPKALLSVKGIGKSLISRLATSTKNSKGLKELLLFLSERRLSHALGMRIYRVFGEMSLARLQEDPYALADRISGIGFKTADEVARSVGIPREDPIRARAGLKWILNEALEAGSMCMGQAPLLSEGQKRLELGIEELKTSLGGLIAKGEVVREPLTGMLYLKKAHHCEVSLARVFRGRLRAPAEPDDLKQYEEPLEKAQKSVSVALSEEQYTIARNLLRGPLAILTGGPGTGKTTLISVLAKAFEARRERFALAAPTGRAAKRLQEVTGFDACTLHKLLEFQPFLGRFRKNHENPLDFDTLIVDETSMVDAFLFDALLDALPKKTRLLLVGDKDQLPPVGPGQVFKDLIQSGTIPYFELTRIFRQASLSTIILGAHAIRQGKIPPVRTLTPSELRETLVSGRNGGDFYLVNEEAAPRIVQAIVELGVSTIPKAFPDLEPSAIQVVTPVHRGPLGTIALNEAFQHARLAVGKIKPPFLQVGAQRFYAGDRILQLKNNYQHEIFNGDIGQVVRVFPENRAFIARFYGRSLEIKGDGLEEMGLAYAISVHKAQGSEFGVVLMPIVTDHFIMLQRNMLYTALTRAKRLAVWIGTKKAVGIGVRSARDERTTGLVDFLRSPQEHREQQTQGQFF